MEKKHIIKFLNGKKRGVYTLIVEMYADIVTSMTVTMAQDMIIEDLEKDSGEKIKLSYFSLAHAVAKYKKKIKVKPEGKRKPEFKDANELSNKQPSPGGFTLPQ